MIQNYFRIELKRCIVVERQSNACKLIINKNNVHAYCIYLHKEIMAGFLIAKTIGQG